VVSAKSPYQGCFDIAYVEESLYLRAGHGYRVRVNEETANPRIAKVFREVEI
jgi:hypothetical protein